ncbi:DUF559 domain-containing protein [Mesorhizobium japonicum]|uniref:DUF559 domain-containing protein n=1 Tax=Mesorhizobium japonicum TaxID=2066070 RepID=UPI0009B5B0A0
MPHTPLPPQNRLHARSMRKAMTDAELTLWNALRAHEGGDRRLHRPRSLNPGPVQLLRVVAFPGRRH